MAEQRRSPSRSPEKSPHVSPGRRSPFGGAPHGRHRSASIPVTPEALKGVRNRFLNAPELCPLGEVPAQLLSVESNQRGRLPRSAPELTVDEASPGSLSPWNEDPSHYHHSLAYTVQKPPSEVLSRRFSETLTVSHEQGRRRRRKSLSPHHGRSMSFRALKKTPEEFRPRGNSVPLFADQSHHRGRSLSPRPSLPLEEDQGYTLRQFCVTSRGDVINKGDLYRPRSRSNNSVASTASTSCSSPGGAPPSVPKRVVVLGAGGVGKTALVAQFVSSEYMHAYDASLEEDVEKNVSILLDGEEYEIQFVDPPTLPETPTEADLEADAFVVVYSITDRGSFERAVELLFRLRDRGCTLSKAVILVGNKADLVRSRAISIEEAKCVACSYECKFAETSAALDHQVDELLVGVVTQIRLKQRQQIERSAFEKPLRKRASLGGSTRRARALIGRLLGKGALKSQSCGNLHVL